METLVNDLTSIEFVHYQSVVLHSGEEQQEPLSENNHFMSARRFLGSKSRYSSI